jgi:hypothetical protein
MTDLFADDVLWIEERQQQHDIYSFLYIRQHNNQTTHFHVCVNLVCLTYGTATQHVSGLTEPSSGNSIYKVIKYWIVTVMDPYYKMSCILQNDL